MLARQGTAPGPAAVKRPGPQRRWSEVSTRVGALPSGRHRGRRPRTTARGLSLTKSGAAALLLFAAGLAGAPALADDLEAINARLRALEERVATASLVRVPVPPRAPSAADFVARDAAICAIEWAEAGQRLEAREREVSRVGNDLARANAAASELRREVLSEGCDERRVRRLESVRTSLAAVDPGAAADESDRLLDCAIARLAATAREMERLQRSPEDPTRTIILTQRMNALTEMRERMLDLAISASSALDFRTRIRGAVDQLHRICEGAIDF